MAKGTERPRSYLLYEKREEEMVSPKDGKQIRRVARFLKPFAADLTKSARFPNTPLLLEVFSPTLQQWPSKVNLNWRMPQKKWEEWIDRLAGKYCSIWNQAGICEAIMSSKYEVRCNKDIILGLAEFWSSETNTFLFPWEEATVTLEDLMVLGGFPVLGRPVTTPVIGSMVEMVEEMEKKRVEMCRNTKAKKACHWNWLRHFIEQKGCNHKHVAFLSLWLSRFVFPSLPEESIGKHVFPIAAHLSLGTRVALAPAVLAGLYKDLAFLKQQTLWACLLT